MQDYTPRSADGVTNLIPPEGDEYNARRQEELHAAVANKATLTRRFYEMVRDEAPAEQIGAIVEVIASLDREIPHISKDLAVSVQGRNLSIFMERMAVELAENLKAIQQAVEDATVRALTDVVISLEQIKDYSQQGVRVARRSEELAKKSITMGEALAAHLVKLEKNLVKLEKAVIVLEKGQKGQSAQLAKFVAEIADLRAQIVTLGLLAEKANTLTEETNRLTEETNRLAEEHIRLTMEHQTLADDVAELKAWRAALEARSDGKQ